MGIYYIRIFQGLYGHGEYWNTIYRDSKRNMVPPIWGNYQIWLWLSSAEVSSLEFRA